MIFLCHRLAVWVLGGTSWPFCGPLSQVDPLSCETCSRAEAETDRTHAPGPSGRQQKVCRRIPECRKCVSSLCFKDPNTDVTLNTCLFHRLCGELEKIAETALTVPSHTHRLMELKVRKWNFISMFKPVCFQGRSLGVISQINSHHC